MDKPTSPGGGGPGSNPGPTRYKADVLSISLGGRPFNELYYMFILSCVNFWSGKCVKSAVLVVTPPLAFPLFLLRLSRANFKHVIQKFTQLSKFPVRPSDFSSDCVEERTSEWWSDSVSPFGNFSVIGSSQSISISSLGNDLYRAEDIEGIHSQEHPLIPSMIISEVKLLYTHYLLYWCDLLIP